MASHLERKFRQKNEGTMKAAGPRSRWAFVCYGHRTLDLPTLNPVREGSVQSWHGAERSTRPVSAARAAVVPVRARRTDRRPTARLAGHRGGAAYADPR